MEIIFVGFITSRKYIMKKILLMSLIAVSLVGCGKIDSMTNKFKSAAGLLDRTITLYDANGKVIKSWNTKNIIVYSGTGAGFVDNNGLNVEISGTFVIEGK